MGRLPKDPELRAQEIAAREAEARAKEEAKAAAAKPVSAPKVAETRGMRPKYPDYRVFRNKVDEYFNLCDDAGVFPDEKGMYLHLGIFEEDLDPLIGEDNPDALEYMRVLKLARYRRESWLSRNMVRDNKMANGCMNALKQEQNGGYIDRPSGSKKQTIEIVMADGVSKDLFK